MAAFAPAATASFFAVGALSDRIKFERSGQQSRDGCVRVSTNAAVQFQPHVFQIILRAAADSSANDDVDVVRGEEPGGSPRGVYDSLNQLDGKKIGVQTGTTAAAIVALFFFPFVCEEVY